MIETRTTKAFGLTTPILSAGMTFVAREPLAAAVCNAGGMGFLGTDTIAPDMLAQMIRTTRTLTSRPFGLDMMVPFFSEAHLEVCLAEPVAVVNFLWGYPDWVWVEKLQNAGSQVWMQARSLDEAKGALQCGLDALIVQAAEGERTGGGLMSVLPAVVDAVPLPVIASGNIVDGRCLAAALALGAEAVRCGTRFLSAIESDSQAEYERRVGADTNEQTVTSNLFTPEWPDPPERVSSFPEEPEQAFAESRPLTTQARDKRDKAAGGKDPLVEGATEAMPAAEIMREMTRQAETILAKYSSLRAVA